MIILFPFNDAQAVIVRPSADFNGDGFADLAIGVPGEDIGTVTDAGAVNVLYGSSAGLSSAGDQLWSQDSVGVEDTAEAVDQFGSALATGDFDNDGFADLAIGVPGEDIGTVSSAGAVNVLYGSSAGLSSAGDQLWSQDSVGVEDTAEVNDFFGSALATGDFDNDGFADLAIGVRFENIGTVTDAGAVNVLFGSSAGLSFIDDQLWSQDSVGVEDKAEQSDQFGSALATGDFNNNGFADLAIGVPFENIGTVTDAGAVNVLFGSSAGLSSAGDQFWHQDSSAIKDVAEAGDRFGEALATGDFDNNGYADLAIGVPFESIGTIDSAGAVNVFYGPGFSSGNQFWHQDSSGINDVAQAGDRFGLALAAGDFGNDNLDDLAIGVPLEDILRRGGGTVGNVGVVNVIYGGSSAGLSSAGDQLWSQNSADVEDVAQAGDLFGRALAVGHFNNNAIDDLAIGVSGEDIGTVSSAGAVNVLYGTPSAVGSPGLKSVGDQFWSQNSAGVVDTAEELDRFGSALASQSLGIE